ncbi:hypothetical protein AMTRI_Chr09g40580 [Amborella trichopoda]
MIVFHQIPFFHFLSFTPCAFLQPLVAKASPFIHQPVRERKKKAPYWLQDTSSFLSIRFFYNLQAEGRNLGVNGLYSFHLLLPQPSSPPNPHSPPSSSDSGRNISTLAVFITAAACSSFTSDVSLTLFIRSSNSPTMAMMGRVRLKLKIVAFSISMRAGPEEVNVAK